MKSVLSFVLAVSLSQFGAPALAAEATGEFWEMTTKMEMAGMPAWAWRRRRCACSRGRRASR
jgi:hypothetical protein